MRASRWMCAAASSVEGLLQEASAQLCERVTPEVAASLSAANYAVVDGALGSAVCATLRAEILALHRSGATVPNASHFVSSGTAALLEKRGVWEAEAHTLSEASAEHAPLLRGLAKDRTMLSLLTVLLQSCSTRAESLVAQTLKAQVNVGGGGCFPLHTDTDASLDTRKWTAIAYLNPDWHPGVGGQLALHPVPGQRVLLEPKNDRLVIFSATDMPHRVLPCWASAQAPRVCLTTWLFGRVGPLTAPATMPPLRGPPPPASVDAWMTPPLRRHAVKAVLRDEWRRSLLEAHPEGEGLAAALRQLDSDVDLIERTLAARFTGSAELLAELRRKCSSV